MPNELEVFSIPCDECFFRNILIILINYFHYKYVPKNFLNDLHNISKKKKKKKASEKFCLPSK